MVELLLVLGIAAVLLGILLPAVEHAREASRRLGCQNHLRQIGLALHAYESNTRCLPPGWVQGSDDRNGWGWLAMVLPELGEANLFNSINFDHTLGNESNQTARLTNVAVFICPSDHTPFRVPMLGSCVAAATSVAAAAEQEPPVRPGVPGLLFEVAGANYAGVFGATDPTDPGQTVGSGAFWANSSTRVAAMTRGTSHILTVGERSASHLATTWTGMDPRDEEGPERVVGFTGHAPNDPAADEAEFSSRHPGGVSFLLADGAVRFLENNMDAKLYRVLAGCADSANDPAAF